MKNITWICDRCGEEITGVVYTLTCFAHDATPDPLGWTSDEARTHNLNANLSERREDRHLCKKCKDAVTDGVFIV